MGAAGRLGLVTFPTYALISARPETAHSGLGTMLHVPQNCWCESQRTGDWEAIQRLWWPYPGCSSSSPFSSLSLCFSFSPSPSTPICLSFFFSSFYLCLCVIRLSMAASPFSDLRTLHPSLLSLIIPGYSLSTPLFALLHALPSDLVSPACSPHPCLIPSLSWFIPLPQL